jgi:hypothetical protein
MKIVRLGPDEVFLRFLTPKWAFVPLSGVGAAIDGGRFNRPGVEALYSRERRRQRSRSTAKALPLPRRRLGQLPRRTPRPSHSSVPTGANAFSVVVDARQIPAAWPSSGAPALVRLRAAAKWPHGGVDFPEQSARPFFR